MRNVLKILALGAAIAASTTMAKADVINGTVGISGQASWDTNGVTFAANTFNGGADNSVVLVATGTFANFLLAGGLPSADAESYSFAYNTAVGGFLFAIGPTPGDYIGLVITGINVVSDSPSFLNVMGTGTVVDSAGDTSEPATWSLTSTANGSSTFTLDSTVTPTPEPSSLALLGTTLLGAAGVARRRLMAR